MKTIFLLTLLCIMFSIKTNAQNDTVYAYRTKGWRQAEKDDAFYFEKTIKEGKLWHGWVYYTKNNQLYLEGYYAKPHLQMLQDTFRYYYENGKPMSIAYFEAGRVRFRHVFYESGKEKGSAKYDNNGKSYDSQWWYEDGRPMPDSIAFPTVIAPPGAGPISFVHIQATFPGGIEKWKEFLQDKISKNLYKVKGNTGTVLIDFLIDTEGNVSEVEVTKSSENPDLDKFAIEIIKSSPKWIPATLNGRNVNYRMKQQINVVAPINH